jgi:hypothetical protein
MPERLVLRLVTAAAVSLFLVTPVAAQTSAPPDSPRGQLIAFGSALGSAQGASTMASLASLEVSTAPLGTSTGGFTYTFDPLRRSWDRTASSFGPSFAERSLTTGRAKVSAGFNWLHAKYNAFDNQKLEGFELKLAQNIRGLAASYSAVDMRMSSDTVVGFAHVGLTNNLDVGVAIPWIRVSQSGQGGLFTSSGAQLAFSTLPKSSTSGVGDVAIFGKYQVWRHQEGGFAVAAEMRLPTGDKNAFRGLDVTRTLVSGIWSLGGRVSPHANVGYEFWSSEVPISADGVIAAKDQYKYAFGVEFAPHPLATIVLDIVGRGVRQGGSVAYQTFPGPGGTSIDALVGIPEGLNQVSFAPGIKWNAWRSMLITGNVLVSLANKGLEATAIPVIGVDWAF